MREHSPLAIAAAPRFRSPQVTRGNAACAREGLAPLVKLQQGDFMALPFKAGTFDAAYAIEATCHAPDRGACFAQIFRALKPGGVFGGYEWVTTPAYTPSNPDHRRIKKDIEVGDGLPDITGGQAVVDALTAAGFVVEEVRDLAPESEVPWYAPFAPTYTLAGIKTTPLGIAVTHALVVVLEALWLAPKGEWERARVWGAARARNEKRCLRDLLGRHVSVSRSSTASPSPPRLLPRPGCTRRRHDPDALAPHRGRARSVQRRCHGHLYTHALLQGAQARGRRQQRRCRCAAEAWGGL